jgi:misacylated tRNA(Ala) deacylase
MTVEKIFEQDAYAKSCDATVVSVSPDGIELDRTVFYAMGGGQPGDQGVLRLAGGGEVAIADTRKGETPGTIIHIPAEGAAQPEVGDAVSAEIDWERRHRLMRIHTCLHLLCSVVEFPVTGGQISDGKGRLDFDIEDAALDKEEITQAVNWLIEENHPVTSRWIDDDELASRPAQVKTMSVAPPSGQGKVRLLDIESVDLQACGGTHVAATGEIGAIRVSKIENKGRHNRRVVVVFADA